jgi:hypothetical protein
MLTRGYTQIRPHLCVRPASSYYDGLSCCKYVQIRFFDRCDSFPESSKGFDMQRIMTTKDEDELAAQPSALDCTSTKFQ